MAKSFFIGIFLLVCIFTAAAGCTGQPAAKTTATPTATVALPDSAASQKAFAALPKAPLNASETEDILYLQESEKFEHDLNAALFGLHNDLPVFLHIANTSQVLMVADNVILERYNIPNPENAKAGSFTNPTLQQMYNNDLNTGLSSVIDGLKSSAQFEDMHIADLTAAIGRTDNTDVIYIYRLELGSSRNNLRALSQSLSGYGAVYAPKYITPASYAQIISSPMEQLPVQ
jgi:hypothetical protein